MDIVDMYRGISPILKDCFLPKKLGKIQKNSYLCTNKRKKYREKDKEE